MWHGVADIKEKIVAHKQIIKREVIRHVSYNTYMKNVAKYFPEVRNQSYGTNIRKRLEPIEHKRLSSMKML